jgi:hypothetical protein
MRLATRTVDERHHGSREHLTECDSDRFYPTKVDGRPLMDRQSRAPSCRRHSACSFIPCFGGQHKRRVLLAALSAPDSRLPSASRITTRGRAINGRGSLEPRPRSRRLGRATTSWFQSRQVGFQNDNLRFNSHRHCTYVQPQGALAKRDNIPWNAMMMVSDVETRTAASPARALPSAALSHHRRRSMATRAGWSKRSLNYFERSRIWVEKRQMR